MKDDARTDRTDTPTRRGPARDTLRPDRRRDMDDRDRDPKGTRPGDRRTADRRRDDDRHRDDGRRRDDDRRRDSDNDRPRRRPLRRARQTIKSAVNRARRATGRLFGKARRKLGNRLNDRLRKMREQWRRSNDRDRSRDRHRDRVRDREKQAWQQGRKDYELPSVRFRAVDGAMHTLLFDGKGKSGDLAMRSTLAAITSYISDWERENNTPPISRQQALRTSQETARKQAESLRERAERAQSGLPDRETSNSGYTRRTGRQTYGEPIFLSGDQAGVAAQLRALRALMEQLATALEQRSRGGDEPPLPDTILPVFSDGDTAKSFKAHFIQEDTPVGTEANHRPDAWPLGWDRAVAQGITARGDWVRMHMLTAVLGGHASTSNLAPARREDNIAAREQAEHPAARAIGKKPGWAGQLERMVWYDVDITMRSNYPGYPNAVDMRWGTYEYPNGHWQRKSRPGGSWTTGSFAPPPWQATGNTPLSVNINQATYKELIAVTKLNAVTAKRVLKLRDGQPGRKFAGMSDLEKELEKQAANAAALAAAKRVIAILQAAETAKRLYFR
ncbi:hypothetical protein ACSNOJ_22685 [Streptomyces sp. URMC 128]|uniref:hypothetical protein n=1 Tax=Streptomyces sp. URMC 128 TaxID=3423404 RepID=UPI003F19B03A